MVPYLKTALTGPLLALESTFLAAMPEIEQWFRSQWCEQTPPFYASVDLRNSGFKLAPVDTNLFPAGFNNLNPLFTPLCVQAAMSALDQVCPKALNLLVIPENHTRNQFYLSSFSKLIHILKLSGLHVRIGSVSPDITESTEVVLSDGSTLIFEPLRRQGSRVGLDDFEACAVLLNNDLSGGVPDILRGLEKQFILPPLHAGWTTRRKSTHFRYFNDVASEFADLLGIDPWLINPIFEQCGGLNFHERQGEQLLVDSVSDVLKRIAEKYRQENITDTPYVVVKADAGTYGMGIMVVKDAAELVGLNRKQRNKMSVVKEGLVVEDVIIQEGVPTVETVNEGSAEPVVYMMDRYVVGGFYRVHTAKGKDDNLNAPGMHFQPLAFETCCSEPDHSKPVDAPPNRFYAYGVVGRLALMAAARELAAEGGE